VAAAVIEFVGMVGMKGVGFVVANLAEIVTVVAAMIAGFVVLSVTAADY
jgi:hypothetical protein